MGIQNGHVVPLLETVSHKKSKKVVKSNKRLLKYRKKGIIIYMQKKKKKKKSCHQAPKVVTDLPFEGRKVEGSWKYRRKERGWRLNCSFLSLFLQVGTFALALSAITLPQQPDHSRKSAFFSSPLCLHTIELNSMEFSLSQIHRMNGLLDGI